VALVCGLGGARLSSIFDRVFAEQSIVALSVREDGLQESLDVAQALFAQLVFVVNFGEQLRGPAATEIAQVDDNVDRFSPCLWARTRT